MLCSTESADQGYWSWQVKSIDETVEWVKRAPFGDGVEVTIRPIFSPEDFGQEATPSCGRGGSSCCATPRRIRDGSARSGNPAAGWGVRACPRSVRYFDSLIARSSACVLSSRAQIGRRFQSELELRAVLDDKTGKVTQVDLQQPDNGTRCP
jgi:hypothetical protein